MEWLLPLAEPAWKPNRVPSERKEISEFATPKLPMTVATAVDGSIVTRLDWTVLPPLVESEVIP